jgi:hypothetical protein
LKGSCDSPVAHTRLTTHLPHARVGEVRLQVPRTVRLQSVVVRGRGCDVQERPPYRVDAVREHRGGDRARHNPFLHTPHATRGDGHRRDDG